jgi:hypothetical protein
VAAEVAAGGGDVGCAGESAPADGEIAQSGHHGRTTPGADLRVILGEETSRIQCSRFSMLQCPRIASAMRSARISHSSSGR